MGEASGGPVKKVAVSMTVLLDYDELSNGIKTGNGRWSPILDFATEVQKLNGVYEIVSIKNLTLITTGREYEEDPPVSLEGDED